MLNSTVTTKIIGTRLEEEPFFYELYYQLRENEMAPWGWSREEQNAFIDMQFKLQCQSYQWQYPQLEARLIYFNHTPIGRVIVSKNEHEWHLIDIGVLPEYQGQGIGSQLILELQDRARNSRLPLMLSVQINNERAIRLYQLLGFQVLSSNGMYMMMKWAEHKEGPEGPNQDC